MRWDTKLSIVAWGTKRSTDNVPGTSLSSLNFFILTVAIVILITELHSPFIHTFISSKIYFKMLYITYIVLLRIRLEKAMAPHSSTRAWKIPWTEEPCRLQSMGLQRVRHDWVTSLHFIRYMYTYIPSLPSHPTSHHLGHHRASSWAPCATQKLPTSSLFHIWQCVYVSATLPIHPTPSFPLCVHSPFSTSASLVLSCK